MNCENCGQKLIRNKYGDLVCPICGIQVYHKEENSIDYKNYKDYIG
jgi:uncharacterized Zn finger protein (UPF0148 family)